MKSGPAAPNPKNNFLKGRASLIGIVIFVAALLIFMPSYRLFFVVSIGLAAIFAVVIYFWHKLVPVKEEKNDDKHPLGLS